MSSKKIIAFDFDGVIVDSLNLSYNINKDFLPDLRYEDWCTWSEGNFHEIIKSRDDIKFLSSDEGYGYFKEKYDQEVVNILPVCIRKYVPILHYGCSLLEQPRIDRTIPQTA